MEKDKKDAKRLKKTKKFCVMMTHFKLFEITIIWLFLFLTIFDHLFQNKTDLIWLIFLF